ncbi:oligosaccharide flippase family protein [Bradyrhizobium sp.]|uniref:oligosaccharide flippase family protein n=1 Tax=Bradyrhizobium sp. TaxID=376 RepID=UPI003C29C464
MGSTSSSVVFKNILHLGAAQVATTALGVLGTAALGRALGPSNFGILYTVNTISGFMGVLNDWGQSTYVVREVARGRSDRPELIGSALLIRTVAIICGSLIAALIAAILGYDNRIVFLAFLAVIVALPITLYAPFAFVFRGMDRMDIDASVNVLGKVLTLVALLAVLYLGAGLAGVILTQCVGGIGVLVVAVSIALRNGLTIKPPTSTVIWELTRSGTPIFLFSLIIALRPFVEVMMLSKLTGPEVVGWYGAYSTIFGIMLSPAMILAQASLPQLSRASLSPSDFRHGLSSMARLLLLAAALAASSLYIFGDYIVAMIFGYGRFQQTVVILRVGAFSLPLLFLGCLLGNALSAVARNKEIAFVSGAIVLAGAAMNWFGITFFQSQFGNGAIALAVTAGITEIAVLFLFKVLLPHGSVGWAMLVDLLRAYAVSICSVLLVPQLDLWLRAPLFLLIFLLISLFSGLMSRKDVEDALVRLRSASTGG